MDMGMDTGQIFIQQVGYGGATTGTLPVLLTPLVVWCYYTGVEYHWFYWWL